MVFEFDEEKSRSNKLKHGIDFVESQALWDDTDRLEIPAKTRDEDRSIVIGQIEGKLWSAIVTYREGKTRMISVRRARKEEVLFYES
jgi:uncharacterized protein